MKGHFLLNEKKHGVPGINLNLSANILEVRSLHLEMSRAKEGMTTSKLSHS